MLIVICFAISSTVTLLFWRISSITLSSFCAVVAVHMLICKHFNPFIHNCYERQHFPHTELMNLSTWYTFCPQKICNRSLVLFGAIFTFHCHVPGFTATLAITATSTRLHCRSHDTFQSPPTPPFPFLPFALKIKKCKNFLKNPCILYEGYLVISV
jgi:hypothetical protein